MEKEILKLFRMEIERQCKFAMIAFDGIKSNLSNMLDKHKDVEMFPYYMDMFWYSTQNFLIAVGDISKILWPPKSKYEKRGEELRKILEIKDNSPIHPRVFRNYFEHFDERLEEWAISTTSHNFIDSNIGPLNMIGNLDSKEYIRHFVPATWTLFFRGDKYELEPIIKAIEELHSKVNLDNP